MQISALELWSIGVLKLKCFAFRVKKIANETLQFMTRNS